MRVLAIDPGFDRLGVAVLERGEGRERLMYSACLGSQRGTPLPERLHELGVALAALFKTHQPTHLAIETLFFNKNVKTAIDVAQARGMVLYLARAAGAIVCEYSPQAVKIAVTGYGKSDKASMTAMVRRLLPEAPTLAQDDEYDAIAVGITCLAHVGRGR